MVWLTADAATLWQRLQQDDATRDRRPNLTVGGLAEIEQLRRQSHFSRNTNTSFAVVDVTLDAPGHALVRTRESWSDETYDRASGRLLQRAPVATYDETYTVEFLNGAWIVTANDLH